LWSRDRNVTAYRASLRVCGMISAVCAYSGVVPIVHGYGWVFRSLPCLFVCELHQLWGDLNQTVWHKSTTF